LWRALPISVLTGQVDKRTLEKFEKEAKDKGRESWFLSWSLDTNPEERDKVRGAAPPSVCRPARWA